MDRGAGVLGQARGQPPPALQPRCCYQNPKQPGCTAVSVQGWGWGQGWGQVCALQAEPGISNHPRASLGPRAGIPLSSLSPGCIYKLVCLGWADPSPCAEHHSPSETTTQRPGLWCGVWGRPQSVAEWVAARLGSGQLCHGGCSIRVRRVLSAYRERTAASQQANYALQQHKDDFKK